MKSSLSKNHSQTPSRYIKRFTVQESPLTIGQTTPIPCAVGALATVLLLLFYVCSENSEKIFAEVFHIISMHLYDLPVIMLGWSMMFTVALLIYPCEHWCNELTKKYAMPYALKSIWKFLQLAVVAVIYFQLIKFGAESGHNLSLKIASQYIISCESFRFLLKIHAYIHELNRQDNVDREKQQFSHYLYFLFAPTLVYRLSYPRTKAIRIWFILLCILEFMVASITFTTLSVPLMKIVRASFETKACYSQGQYFKDYLVGLVYAIPIFLIFELIVMHTWQNLWAEMMRFADRQFYGDWWTSTNYGTFYRKWNKLVHEWFVQYVYMDMLIWAKGNTAIAQASLILISAIAHEIHAYGFLNVFMPNVSALYLVAGVVIAASRNPSFKNMYNFLFWYFFGFATCGVAYVYEYYSYHLDRQRYQPFHLLYALTGNIECHDT